MAVESQKRTFPVVPPSNSDSLLIYPSPPKQGLASSKLERRKCWLLAAVTDPTILFSISGSHCLRGPSLSGPPLSWKDAAAALDAGSSVASARGPQRRAPLALPTPPRAAGCEPRKPSLAAGRTRAESGGSPRTCAPCSRRLHCGARQPLRRPLAPEIWKTSEIKRNRCTPPTRHLDTAWRWRCGSCGPGLAPD
ncbi:uncharacterized protein LOC117099245 [Trachypithecus francoisi]|uniref:uncharacterized protein LOC117099245 n=1 Tax=Trachypithecus francoisi TaxID=54180 RepID=UPI00141AF44B|nr:uncharacterized protein LOC117099245 [Trachypithecus francoisi]